MPGAEDISDFKRALKEGGSRLEISPSPELGRRLFAVGDPPFQFERYRSWITERSGEARFTQLQSKMGENCLFAIGAFIQALQSVQSFQSLQSSQTPGSEPALEAALRKADEACHIYIGSGVGDLPLSYAAARQLDDATHAWQRFWASPAHCTARRAYEESRVVPSGKSLPPVPETFAVDSEERLRAVRQWHAFWAEASIELKAFEEAYAAIEQIDVGDNLTSGPLNAIRARQRAHRRLIDSTGCPAPPWTAVDTALIWGIQNVPAAQISMLLSTHGPAWAPVAACSTFGVALKCGRDAIARGEAKVAIVGTTDPRPDPALVSAFHKGRLTPGTGTVNQPWTTLRGTNIAGGACVWIIGDIEYMRSQGLSPVGGTVEGVALSSDAEHIITPSESGPKRAIRQALAEAGISSSEQIATWDMHATGTPGDSAELNLIQEFIGDQTLLTARKGVFGHGMANCGGWELTALAMGLNDKMIAASGMARSEIHPGLLEQRRGAFTTAPSRPSGPYGVKVTVGIGGITSCIVLKAANS